MIDFLEKKKIISDPTDKYFLDRQILLVKILVKIGKQLMCVSIVRHVTDLSLESVDDLVGEIVADDRNIPLNCIISFSLRKRV